MDKQNLTDEQLLKKYRNGCQLSFTILFNRYEKVLVRYALSMTTNYEEIVQDTFLKLINNPPRFILNQSLKSWLFKVAYHLCINRLKSDSKNSFVEEEGLKFHIDEKLKSPHDNIVHTEDIELLKQSVDNLPDKYKEVVALHIFAELPFKEVAKITKTPLGTALWRMRKAVEILRNMLNDEEVGEKC